MDLAEINKRYAAIPARKRLAAMVGVPVAVLVAFYFLVVAGLQQSYDELYQQANVLELARQDKHAYAADLPRYESEFKGLSESLATARSLLPDTPDVPQFLSLLGTSARDVGMHIKRFEPHDEVPQDFYSEINFRLTVSGTYHEIAMFIDRIGRFDRIVNVQNIAMKDPLSDNDRAVVQGTFDVKAFRFLSEHEAAAVAEAAAKKAKAK